MLRSYEAIYKNGQLRWLSQMPAQPNEEIRVLVVFEVNEASVLNIGSLNRTVGEIDHEIDECLKKWRSQPRQKPQGGRLRPLIQGKTVSSLNSVAWLS
jgi:hypothetical protein